jgi:hypothetical protein
MKTCGDCVDARGDAGLSPHRNECDIPCFCEDRGPIRYRQGPRPETDVRTGSSGSRRRKIRKMNGRRNGYISPSRRWLAGISHFLDLFRYLTKNWPDCLKDHQAWLD